MPNFQHHNDHSFEMHEHKLLELSKPENFLWHPFMLKKKVTEYFNSRPKLYISASDPSNCQKLWTKLISSQLNSRLQRYSNLTFFFHITHRIGNYQQSRHSKRYEKKFVWNNCFFSRWNILQFKTFFSSGKSLETTKYSSKIPWHLASRM